MKKDIPRPHWLIDERYNHLNCANAPDAAFVWLRELERCADLVREVEDARDKKSHWREEFREVVGSLPQGRKVIPIENMFPAYIGPAPLTVIMPKEGVQAMLLPGWAKDMGEVRQSAYDPAEAKCFPVMTVSVNFDAPDAVLMQDFCDLLREARKQIPSSLNMPGRKTDELNRTFTPRQFRSWFDWGIVPLCDIDYYFSHDDKSAKPTDVQIGSWLYGKRKKQPGREVAEARTQLRKAIAMIPDLYAYCIGKRPK